MITSTHQSVTIGNDTYVVYFESGKLTEVCGYRALAKQPGKQGLYALWKPGRPISVKITTAVNMATKQLAAAPAPADATPAPLKWESARAKLLAVWTETANSHPDCKQRLRAQAVQEAREVLQSSYSMNKGDSLEDIIEWIAGF